jgi:nucleotide-binding universal stress UspA family protein
MATKILFPIAGSKSAQKVLPKVAEMAKTLNAKVTLFHACYSGVGAFAGEGSPATIRAEEAQEQKFCETYMAKAAADLKNKGLNVDYVCKDGLPARQIIGYAQDKGYDLIVMGAQDAHEIF